MDRSKDNILVMGEGQGCVVAPHLLKNGCNVVVMTRKSKGAKAEN